MTPALRSVRDSEPTNEPVGDEHVLCRQVVDRGLPERTQRGVDPAGENVEHVFHTGLACRGQTPQVRSADHHGPGAQRERFHDIEIVDESFGQDND